MKYHLLVNGFAMEFNSEKEAKEYGERHCLGYCYSVIKVKVNDNDGKKPSRKRKRN